MTDKELRAHEWKESETVYVLGMREYQAFSIPVKVIKAKVTKVEKEWFYLKTCNKKDEYLLPAYAFYTKKYAKYSHRASRLFLTKSDAKQAFEYVWKYFIRSHKDRLYSRLISELNELDRQKNTIFGIMRMKIMRT